MNEPHFSSENEQPAKESTLTTWVIVIIAVAAIVIPIYYYLNVEKPLQQAKTPVVEVTPVPIIEPVESVEPEPIEPEPVIELELVEEPEMVEEEVAEPTPQLPNLDNSDTWVKEALTNLTWRKELLRLVIDEDMIRKLVVFTDNFSQGIVSYEYSPLVKPSTKFAAIESKQDGKELLLWNETQTKRFTAYVDFLRSFEPEKLAAWYVELKPLIIEAYEELGYPEQDFTPVLQEAITRILDMEIPKEDIELVRPSVMYKFKASHIESLPETDKLLIRIGRENLLIIKSFLLEFSDALSRAEENNL